ncbi:MAG: hypothetical protein KC731_16335 [Myxococcales bacterium]|nr:hypothetical protein [Myxococcales bacterium]
MTKLMFFLAVTAATVLAGCTVPRKPLEVPKYFGNRGGESTQVAVTVEGSAGGANDAM